MTWETGDQPSVATTKKEHHCRMEYNRTLPMSKKTYFTLDQARTIGEQLGVRWDRFDVNQFRAGLLVELEHGTVDSTTDVTSDDPLITGKIALAHLTEFPDYYTRLEEMETQAENFWASKKARATTEPVA